MKMTKYIKQIDKYEYEKKVFDDMTNELHDLLKKQSKLKLTEICKILGVSKQMLRIKFKEKKFSILQIRNIIKLLETV
jgi:hypothetical protein